MDVLIIRTNKENEIVNLNKKAISEKNVLFPFSVFVEARWKKNDLLIFSTRNLLLKEKLLTIGGEIFPFDEKKLSRVIEIKESAVALVIDRTQPVLSISQKLKTLQKKTKPSFQISSVKERFKDRIFAFPQVIKDISLKIKKLAKNLLQTDIERIFNIPKRIPIKLQKIKFSKKTLFVFLGIFVFFLASLGFFLFQEREKKIILQKIQSIQDLKLKAESSLIYGDKKEATFYLKEALKLIEDAKEKAKAKEIKKINNIKKEIGGRLGALLGRETVENPKLIFEIKEKVKKWKPEGMMVSEKEIYLWSSSSELVFRWNIPAKEGVFIPLEIEKVDGGTLVQKRPIFIDKKGEVSIIGKKIKLKYPKIEIEKMEVSSFNEYFYIFDKKNGEILKFRLEEKKEILEGISWLKEKGVGKNAKSFAIDGRVYLLFDKKIKKFAFGKEIGEINLPEAYPSIKNLTKIFTSKENRYLYLFEPEEKRVIILKKDGEKIKEYFLPELKNLKDFWISLDDKTIYLLDEGKVFSVENPAPF